MWSNDIHLQLLKGNVEFLRVGGAGGCAKSFLSKPTSVKVELGFDNIHVLRSILMTGMWTLNIGLICLQLSGCLGKFGPSGFIEYREGDTGIIIAVPHGGEWDNPDIPPRTEGTSESDDDTKELGEAVTSSLCTSLGKCPHIIISYLKRSKLDPNREIVEAAQGDPLAETAWGEYHGFIEEAKKKEGLGLVIDLHGQSHLKNSTELGYLLTREQLNAGEFNSEESSVRELSRRQGMSGKEVIVGTYNKEIPQTRKNYHDRFPESWSIFRKRGIPCFPFPQTT